MSFLKKYLAVSVCLQVLWAVPAFAVRMGTGTLSIDVIGSPSDFTVCVLATYSNTNFDVFGTTVNLGTQAQSFFCVGQTVGGVPQGSHCSSTVSGAFSFDMNADVLCNPSNCLGSASFISTSVYNVSGTIPASLGSMSYTSDGSVDFTNFIGAPTIAGCPATGSGPHYEGTIGVNAFQLVATPSGADVEVSSSPTFFNPITNQPVTVSVDIGFASVGTPGETLVTASSNSSASLSSNFAASVDGYQAAFLEISTTATIAPPITICSSYPDDDDNGIIDGTTLSESTLRILHGEGTPPVFVDRTVSQDTAANRICAEVDSLSPFVTVVNFCGNGAINGDEACDDGNTTAGDGCSADCHVQSGWQCATPGSACTFVCGNSVVNSSETCDDGNATPGDGCSAVCQVEAGWQCPTPGAACTYVCGNSVVNGSEQCDDGNTTDGDGCSASCTLEPCYNCPTPGSLCTPLTGVSCDDGDACTTGDKCQSGACLGTPKVCQPLGPCFDGGTCNPSSGVCSSPSKADGAPCSDGDGCSGDKCMSAQCQPAACPAVDAVVLNRAPLNVTIGKTATSVAKKLAVTVRNADSVDRTIALAVDTADCPAALAGTPDFDPSTPLTSETSILVKAGKTKVAKIPLVFLPADFTSFNFKSGSRCTLQLTAAAVVAGGSNDPTPSNNLSLVEVNVIDKHDTEQAAPTVHESTVKSVAPKTLVIPTTKTSNSVTLKAVVGNADYRPTAENPGDAIALSASTTCVGLTVTEPICDTATSSDTVTVKGGATKTCKMTATAFSGPISTTNKLSPQRCTVTLTAAGPTDPEAAPLDSTNNVAEVLIDVLDKHDH